MEEFKIHVEENGARYDEVVKIDVAKNTETIHVPAYNNMDEGDIIHDFNKAKLFKFSMFLLLVRASKFQGHDTSF